MESGVILAVRTFPGGDAVEIPVLIEPVAGNGYRARGGEPFALCAEGATRAEALEKLRDQVRARLAAGADLVALAVPPPGHPWQPFAGMFPKDPLIDDWKQAVAEYRRQV